MGDAKILHAYKLLETALESTNLSAEQRAGIEESTLFCDLSRKKKQIDRVHAMIYEDKKDWISVSNKNGVRTSYQQTPGMSSLSFLLEGRVKTSLLKICVVLLQVDLYKFWLPQLALSKELGRPSRYEKLIRLLFYAPWPLDKRENILEGYGVNFLEEEDALMIILQSLDDGLHKDFIPDKEPGVVRGDIHIGGFYMKVVSPEESDLTLVMNVDPKLGFVPEYILNACIRQVLGWVFHWLEKCACSIDVGVGEHDEVKTGGKYAEYTDRVRDDPELYEHMRQLFDVTLQRMKRKGSFQ